MIGLIKRWLAKRKVENFFNDIFSVLNRAYAKCLREGGTPDGCYIKALDTIEVKARE